MGQIENFENWDKKKAKWRHMGGSEEEILTKWKGVGLIESLAGDNTEHEKDFAMALERVCSLMVNESQVIAGVQDHSTLVMATIARIMRALPEMLNYDFVSSLYTFVSIDIRGSYHLCEGLCGAPGMDAEAELCAVIADKYINIYSGGE